MRNMKLHNEGSQTHYSSFPLSRIEARKACCPPTVTQRSDPTMLPLLTSAVGRLRECQVSDEGDLHPKLTILILRPTPRGLQAQSAQRKLLRSSSRLAYHVSTWLSCLLCS